MYIHVYKEELDEVADDDNNIGDNCSGQWGW